MHRHGGLVKGSARRAAAVVDATEVGEFLDPQISRYVDLVIFLHGEEHHAIDLFRPESGIADGGVAAFDGQSKRAAARILGEIRCADPHYGRLTCEVHAHLSVFSMIDMPARQKINRIGRR